jgi:nicotinamidase-related amidase
MPSPDRLTAHHGALLIVDVQEKLVARMKYGPLMIANCVRLVRGAEALNLPVFATEQYPSGLGSTVPELAALLPHRPDKTAFSCCAVGELIEQLHGRGVRHVTLAGIETHVCIAQTALELLSMGFVVQVPADAVASRFKMDWEFALRRMEHAGVIVSTTEAVLFEWTGTADAPAFPAISRLVKEFVPPPKRKEERRVIASGD